MISCYHLQNRRKHTWKQKYHSTKCHNNQNDRISQGWFISIFDRTKIGIFVCEFLKNNIKSSSILSCFYDRSIWLIKIFWQSRKRIRKTLSLIEIKDNTRCNLFERVVIGRSLERIYGLEDRYTSFEHIDKLLVKKNFILFRKSLCIYSLHDTHQHSFNEVWLMLFVHLCINRDKKDKSLIFIFYYT